MTVAAARHLATFHTRNALSAGTANFDVDTGDSKSTRARAVASAHCLESDWEMAPNHNRAPPHVPRVRGPKAVSHAPRISSKGPMLIMIINFVRTSQTGPAHYGLARFVQIDDMAAPTANKLKLMRTVITTVIRPNARKSIVAENLVRILVFQTSTAAMARTRCTWQRRTTRVAVHALVAYKCSDGILIEH
ncbi:predicted protein [Pyrenophora tritici-repentis Pt-1C-BFP]|uniref:Uncharacterized protein n=1 Tax=Pyrenophora tritici-repentis (strain Pt-1C-BFP) TaxID=426418 RepID=B2WLH2_PYRTR|nr:uncharacterized protein PTRG_10832 [Pyrenophora tritici-repentis Pt-1C-BFP]EDU43882.1 predicted protein [Pyrenophora tritici-repentis Pt-1C-BFP]